MINPVCSITICFPPGHRYAYPGIKNSPSSASLTVILDAPSNLSAKGFEKAAGICCAITILAGISGEILGNRCDNALGPPVDIPIPIIENFRLAVNESSGISELSSYVDIFGMLISMNHGCFNFTIVILLAFSKLTDFIGWIISQLLFGYFFLLITTYNVGSVRLIYQYHALNCF